MYISQKEWLNPPKNLLRKGLFLFQDCHHGAVLFSFVLPTSTTNVLCALQVLYAVGVAMKVCIS